MKILVIRLGAVGDIIRTVPAVLYLKKHFENISISWIAEDWACNLLVNHPDIDNLYIIPRKKYSKVFEILKQIKKENFDYVLDFHGILKSGLISYFTGIKKRIGYQKENCKELNFIFNNIKAPKISEKVTRIEKNFNLIKPLINDFQIPEKLETNFYIEQSKKEYINNFLKNLNKFKIKIGINPCTSRSGAYKEWPIEYFKKFISLISNHFGEDNVCFIVTWGPEEYNKVKPLKISKNIVLAPETDMKELLVLISNLDIFITGDTGPMHLASVLNIPILALFGPSDAEVNKPWGNLNRVVKIDVGCNPCRNKSCNDLKCQYKLTPEYVFENFLKFIKALNQTINYNHSTK
jgi:lipopolysaccharide heptosyltransferase II